jgi:hypothetical protein
MKGKRLAADRRRTEPIELPLRGVVNQSRKLLPLFRALPASRRSLPAWQHLQVGEKGSPTGSRRTLHRAVADAVQGLLETVTEAGGSHRDYDALNVLK